MYFNQKDYVKNQKEYQAMLSGMAEEVTAFAEDFEGECKDDPRFLSGYGHGYFCNEDGGRLIYDRKSPFSHVCSICGKVYTDYIYSSYFITMFRNEAVVTAIKAGILYQVYKDQKYLDILQNIIGFYTENYRYFAVHAKDKINCDVTADVAGAGRIMPQGLNEAILAIRFTEALELVKDAVSKEWLDWVKKELFEPVYELLLPQKMHIHNIPTWINSAFGVMGLFFSEEKWVKEATQNPYNLYEQIENGVTDSGFWYEGSIHYNFFAMEGIMSYLVFAGVYNKEVPEHIQKTILSMFKAAYEYAFDNDIFPNPGDGWPNISLQTYSYVYYMGYKVFGKVLLPYIHHIETTDMARGRLPLSEPYYYQNRISLERLMFGADCMEITAEEAPVRGSRNFAGSNCAVLRNEDYNVFLKYGHQTKSHAHPDKMNVEIMVGGQVLTKDLSNAGYASKMCNSWHRTIAAHNTCAVNGEPTDLSRAGEVVRMTNTEICAKVQAYDDVTYTRRIELKDKSIYDEFTVEGTDDMVIDWFFHFETEIDRSGLVLVPAEEDLGYPYMEGIQRIDQTGTVMIRNEIAEAELVLEEGASLYLVQTYNNPADRMRDTIIVRKRAKNADFSMKISRI